jgi:glycogen debranching enzyme
LLDIPASERGARCVVQASLDEPGEPERDMLEIKPALALRRARLGKHFGAASAGKTLSDPEQRTLAALIEAADAFVVARAAPPRPSGNKPTDCESLTHVSVIAGYPWFGDWGRDTCIALPGLMLSTGRHDDARRTLTAFAKARKDGIIPNLFNDQSGHAEYNTVDASLWFVHAACAYASASGDRALFESDLLPACLEIIGAYRRGTMFNIAMDPMDKLITAGSASTQLTWMDAKRDGVVFTPRFGKAVEINALWYSALKLLSEQLRPRDPTAGANLNDLADAVGRSFRKSFWNAGVGGLYDCLSPADDGSWRASDDLRPNQLFAVSLPHSALSAAEQASVLKLVRDRLLTPMGVRTLAQGDWRYKGRYEGTLFQRDAAYHNGTAWPWLLGAYAEGVLRTGGHSEQSKREARAALQPMIDALQKPAPGSGACAGQIAEIFDGDAPQRPQGCTAQAWSIAEVLRVWLMTV